MTEFKRDCLESAEILMTYTIRELVNFGAFRLPGRAFGRRQGYSYCARDQFFGNYTTQPRN